MRTVLLALFLRWLLGFARPIVERVLRLDPENKAAKEMMAKLAGS